MLRSLTVTLAAAAAVALSACGSGADAEAPGATAETAKAAVERAARVELAAERIPGEAREQGLRASYSNAATAVKDGQVVALFVLEDADVAGKISDEVRGSAPKSSRLIVNDRIMVVYATAGSDRGAAVERAVEAL